ncbi:coiled-coil domain-containing protein 24 [Octopus bimaculoides]|uniref:Coiled-coil domain-containing protein 24 n=1 Tax=Octopus bimaculoides TaxID=37653 RepID=A0A0L8HYA0_OCTBM|nr:coiled-coil domain-containing protein 24 [Octopus bimaculoides]|eukprot:XP_014768668.1 PREDICTED: coiled-coil domain-containing protein 24-like [Octopus bimaculoides]
MTENTTEAAYLPHPLSSHLYKVPLSVWKLIEQTVPDSERQEIKNILGVGLVEESIQLQNELETLQEIFKEYQERNLSQVTLRIPEPPTARETLIKEIAFLISSIIEKAEYNGLDSSQVLSKYNKEIRDYVSQQQEIYQETKQYDSISPVMSKNQSISSNINQCSNSMKDEIQAMIHSLDYLKIDDVAQELRSRLEDEIRQLLRNIELLQNNLDVTEQSVSETVSTSKKVIPTISELRLERKLLEEELLKESTSRKSTPSPSSALKLPAKKPNRNVDAVDKNIKKPNSSENLCLGFSQYRFLPHPPGHGKPKENSAEKFRRMIYNSRSTQ